MINNDQSTLLLYCCEDVNSHRSAGDTVPLTMISGNFNQSEPRILYLITI